MGGCGPFIRIKKRVREYHSKIKEDRIEMNPSPEAEGII